MSECIDNTEEMLEEIDFWNDFNNTIESVPTKTARDIYQMYANTAQDPSYWIYLISKLPEDGNEAEIADFLCNTANAPSEAWSADTIPVS